MGSQYICLCCLSFLLYGLLLWFVLLVLLLIMVSVVLLFVVLVCVCVCVCVALFLVGNFWDVNCILNIQRNAA